MGAPTSLAGVLPHGNSLSDVAAGETTRRTTGAVLSGKKQRQPLQSRRPSRAERAPPHAPCRSESSGGRALCRADGPGRVEPRRPRGACRQGFRQSTPTSNFLTPTGPEAPKQPKLTATRKTARPKKPEPKPAAAPKPVAAKPKTKAVAIVETGSAKSTTPKLVVPTHSLSNPLEEISYILDHLPLQACLELTRRLLTSIFSHPTEAARPRAVLKTVILFVAEYGSTP